MKAAIETIALVMFLGYVALATAGHGAYSTPATCLFFSAIVIYTWEIWFRPFGKSAARRKSY